MLQQGLELPEPAMSAAEPLTAARDLPAEFPAVHGLDHPYSLPPNTQGLAQRRQRSSTVTSGVLEEGTSAAPPTAQTASTQAVVEELVTDDTFMTPVSPPVSQPVSRTTQVETKVVKKNLNAYFTFLFR